MDALTPTLSQGSGADSLKGPAVASLGVVPLVAPTGGIERWQLPVERAAGGAVEPATGLLQAQGEEARARVAGPARPARAAWRPVRDRGQAALGFGYAEHDHEQAG